MVDFFKRYGFVLLVLVFVLVLVVFVVFQAGFYSGRSADKHDLKNTVVGSLELDVKADKDWTKDSTPAIAHITDTKPAEAKDKVDFYHAILAEKDNTAKAELKVPVGEYKVEVITPVNKDGSLYEVKPAVKAETVKVETESTASVKVQRDLAKVPAERVTDAMLKDVVDKVNKAVEKGDESLKGPVGKAVAEKTAETPAVNKPAQPNYVPAPKAASKPVPAPAPDSKPAPKTRTVTEKVWVPNVVTIVDHPARNERVYTGSKYVFSYDGYTTTDKKDLRNHGYMLAKKHIEDTNYVIYPIYETRTIPAVTHTEDRGHWETRTRTITE